MKLRTLWESDVDDIATNKPKGALSALKQNAHTRCFGETNELTSFESAKLES